MVSWRAEVNSGQPLYIKVGKGKRLHLQKASLGEIEKEAKDSVRLHVHVEKKKLVIGTLHPERLPEQELELVFYEDFQLSHTLEKGSVFFCGYRFGEPDADLDYSSIYYDSDYSKDSDAISEDFDY